MYSYSIFKEKGIVELYFKTSTDLSEVIFKMTKHCIPFMFAVVNGKRTIQLKLEDFRIFEDIKY